MATRRPVPADRRARLAAVRAEQARQDRRRRMRSIGLIALAVAVIGAALTAVALTDHNNRAAATKLTAAGAALTTPPPWPAPPTGEVPALVRAAGLPLLQMEATHVHFHAHLDVIVDGKAVQVPADVGIGNTSLSPLHIHGATGIIHIEAPKAATFTLGQLFTEWNVPLTPSCIGGLCVDSTHQLGVYVNGKPDTGDPRQLVLAAHQEIAIEYGQRGQLPTPPSSYTFPSGT